MIHATQLLFMLPLKLVPGDWAKQKYEEGIRETKGAFGEIHRCAVLAVSCWLLSSDFPI